MLKAIAYWGSALALATVLGVGSVVVVLKRAQFAGGLQSGPWATSTTVGSPDADMYTRAQVALFGLLALDKQETMYFTASSDSAGAPLSGDCTYRLEGRDLAARWWSITAYGPDSYLIPNPPRVYSFAQTTVGRDAGGGFVIRASADPQDGNWLPLQAGERFDLTARLYNPDASVYADPAGAALPTIVRERCR